jgi:hypothetical protein
MRWGPVSGVRSGLFLRAVVPVCSAAGRGVRGRVCPRHRRSGRPYGPRSASVHSSRLPCPGSLGSSRLSANLLPAGCGPPWDPSPSGCPVRDSFRWAAAPRITLSLPPWPSGPALGLAARPPARPPIPAPGPATRLSAQLAGRPGLATRPGCPTPGATPGPGSSGPTAPAECPGSGASSGRAVEPRGLGPTGSLAHGTLPR